MGDWDFPLVDFFDQRAVAINRHAHSLAQLSDVERTAACRQIQDRVRTCVGALQDRLLLKAAVCMVDDLYKYVNDTVIMDQALLDYLNASGRTFTMALHERGYVIRYVVENQFSNVGFLMFGPFDVFQKVFNAAGFVYICPQQIGLELMRHDGLGASDYTNAIAQYKTELRVVANRLAIECHEGDLHYVFLDADYEEGSLDIALRGRGVAGVLHIFRNDAPVPGSSVDIDFPEQTRGGQWNAPLD